MNYNPHGPDWHKSAPPDIGLAEYAKAWIDMEPHVGHLTALAKDAKVIVEFGIRGAVSTWAMLDGLPEDGRLIGVDIDPNVPIPDRVRDDPRFTFLVGDSLAVPLPEHADLVMIDSSHEFAQTVAELDRAAGLTPAVIALHDVLYVHAPGVQPAIEEFTAVRPWRVERIEPSQWGLAVLVPRQAVAT